MSVFRIYVEKKPEFAVEAASLLSDIKSALGLEGLDLLLLKEIHQFGIGIQ